MSRGVPRTIKQLSKPIVTVNFLDFSLTYKVRRLISQILGLNGRLLRGPRGLLWISHRF